MVKIQTYTIADLRRLLNPGPWFAGDPIPITRERALSQINNPRADESDVVLLVAYDGDVVVAHLGVVPDLAFTSTGQHKVGWLTAWWANPDRKYSGAGMMLMMRAMALYKNGAGASGFSEDAKRVYAATRKFTTIKELPGISAFTKFDARHLLPKRFPALKRITLVLEFADAVANQFVRIRQVLWRRRQRIPQGVRVEYVPELDFEAEQFITKNNTNEFARRGAEELNWIGKYSWMTRAPLGDPPAFRFATTASSNCCLHLKIYDGSAGLVAVVMLSIIDDHLIIPCCHHRDRGELVARIIGHHLALLRVKRVTTYRGDLVENFSRLRFPWVWSANKTRSWIMAGTCVAGQPAFEVQDGDGDCAFTV